MGPKIFNRYLNTKWWRQGRYQRRFSGLEFEMGYCSARYMRPVGEKLSNFEQEHVKVGI